MNLSGQNTVTKCDIPVLEAEPRTLARVPGLVHGLLGAEQKTVPGDAPDGQSPQPAPLRRGGDDVDHTVWERLVRLSINADRIRIMREGDGGGAQTAAVGHRTDDTVGPGRFSGLTGNERDGKDTEAAKREASTGTHSDEVGSTRDNHGRRPFLLLEKEGNVEIDSAVRNCDPGGQEPVIGGQLLGHIPLLPSSFLSGSLSALHRLASTG